MIEIAWRSCRKYILQITQLSKYRYAKLQYRFAVTPGSPSTIYGYQYIKEKGVKEIMQIVSNV